MALRSVTLVSLRLRAKCSSDSSDLRIRLLSRSSGLGRFGRITHGFSSSPKRLSIAARIAGHSFGSIETPFIWLSRCCETTTNSPAASSSISTCVAISEKMGSPAGRTVRRVTLVWYFMVVCGCGLRPLTRISSESCSFGCRTSRNPASPARFRQGNSSGVF